MKLSPSRSRFGNPGAAPRGRSRRSRIFAVLLFTTALVAVASLCLLLVHTINFSFGPAAVELAVDPEDLTGPDRSLESLSTEDLVRLLQDHLPQGTIARLEREAPLKDLPSGDLSALVEERIIQPTIVRSWTLLEGLFRADEIQRYFDDNPYLVRRFKAWFNPRFLIEASGTPAVGMPGIGTALAGTLWTLMIALIISFPIGIGTAVYLEEFAGNHRLNRLIQINIFNLAGVPPIIFGLLGLTLSVRFPKFLTGGSLYSEASIIAGTGRTILSAGLTLAAMILPILILTTQEALRSAPDILRMSSYSLGATRWQTVRHHLLPYASERIVNGAVTALSRAVGEAAPLVVIGASAFLSIDPITPHSRFTTIPVLIFQWSARPQQEYRHLTAAAVLALLLLLAVLNAAAAAVRISAGKQGKPEGVVR